MLIPDNPGTEGFTGPSGPYNKQEATESDGLRRRSPDLPLNPEFVSLGQDVIKTWGFPKSVGITG